MEKLFGQKKIDRDNAIVAAFRDGKSVKDLCDQFSVSKHVVNSAIFKSGIVRRNWCGNKPKISELDQKGIVRMYQSGKAVREIQLMYGISESTVYDTLRKFDIKRRNSKPLSDKKKKDICRYYRLGWDFQKIGEAVGAKASTVANYISKQGLCNRNASRQNKELLMAPIRLDGTPDLRKVEPVADKVEEAASMKSCPATASTADYIPPKNQSTPQFKISKIITIDGKCYRYILDGDEITVEDPRANVNGFMIGMMSRETFIEEVRELAAIADMLEKGEV